MGLNKVFAKYFIASNDALNENRHTCKECGGACCKGMGCHISPNDMKNITFDSIVSLMKETNCISVDWYEGHPTNANKRGPHYFLRIRNNNGSMIDPSWGGQCCLLGEDGCPLSFKYRPLGGRALQPKDEHNKVCTSGYSKAQCTLDWLPYQDILEKVFDYFDDFRVMCE